MSVDLWPVPDPATGDGSDYGEGGRNDGTPGAVEGEALTTPPTGARIVLRSVLAPVQRLVLSAVSRGDWPSIPSPNYSSRRNAKVRLIIFHSAEGALTRSALGNFFSRSSVAASSHVGIDDTGITRYVPDAYSAWTARNANPVAVQAELCAFAAWTRGQWLAHPGMLENAAQWAAKMSVDHGIPLVRIQGAETVKGAGVCCHIDITRGWGVGSHVDCGTQFPVDAVIERARQIVSGTDELEELLMTTVDNPYSGGKEDATVALGYMEQRIREGIKTYLPALVAAAVRDALADSFKNLPPATVKALMDQPVDDVATWDQTSQTVVQKPSSFLYLIKRAAEASPVRHFLMDKTK